MKAIRNKEVEALKNLFMKFENVEISHQDPLWKDIESLTCSLVVKGWSRKEIFEAVRRIEDEWSGPIPDLCFNALDGFISGLLGDCAPSCIIHLPGEPKDEAELTQYVRGREWLR